MLLGRMQRLAVLMVLGIACGAAAPAQVKEVKAVLQTDVAVSLYGAFAGTTDGKGVQQTPANAAGGMVEVRNVHSHLFGWEGTYSFNRANQTYTSLISPVTCGIICGTPTAPTPQSIKANAHEVTGDWVVSLPVGGFRPFALAGGGVLLNVPVSGQTNTSTSMKGVFSYGAGLDWGLLPHLGLRLQYRGNLYSAPQLSTVYTSSGAFLKNSEPMIGVYFKL